jgi:hypothetical protein
LMVDTGLVNSIVCSAVGDRDSTSSIGSHLQPRLVAVAVETVPHCGKRRHYLHDRLPCQALDGTVDRKAGRPQPVAHRKQLSRAGDHGESSTGAQYAFGSPERRAPGTRVGDPGRSDRRGGDGHTFGRGVDGQDPDGFELAGVPGWKNPQLVQPNRHLDHAVRSWQPPARLALDDTGLDQFG